MQIYRIDVEIVLLADSWRADCSGFLELVIGISSDSGVMKTKIEGK